MSENKEHIVVVNRWRERYADYARYADHDAHRVTYVTTEIGLGSVPPGATDAVLVARTDDLASVRTAVTTLASRYGPPTGVVALKEDDLLIGARLRREWDCPGPQLSDLAAFRDKLLMCRAVQRRGLPVPAFAPAPDPAAVRRFAGTHGWPVIVKPLVGSSSQGVVQVAGPAETDRLDFTEPMLVQRFQPDPIHHVDGVFTGRELAVWRASRYLNTCLEFRSGGYLGSVEVDDPPLLRAIGDAATAYLSALTREPVVFHLEVFVGSDGGRPVCSFLEVGARAGGAEVPLVWREVHGYDLMEAAFRIQLGQRPPAPVGPADPETAGWLLVPAPASRPCRVTGVTSMLGRDPGPYAEAVLPAGAVIPAADAYYEHVGGRFRFRGRGTAQVARAIEATARDFRVTGEPLPPAPAPGPHATTAMPAGRS